MYPFELVSLYYSLGQYPVAQFLDHRVVLFLTLWGTSILFFTMVAPVCIPTNNVREFLFPHVLDNTCFLCCWFLAILTGVRWYLIVVFDFHLPDVKWWWVSFMFLLTSCISSLKKCLFMYYARFKNGLFAFWVLICISSLYILDTNPL